MRPFFERAIDLHGVPEKITIDKSGAIGDHQAEALLHAPADLACAFALDQREPIGEVAARGNPEVPSSVESRRLLIKQSKGLEMQTFKFDVKGMSCGRCISSVTTQKIESTLAAMGYEAVARA